MNIPPKSSKPVVKPAGGNQGNQGGKPQQAPVQGTDPKKSGSQNQPKK